MSHNTWIHRFVRIGVRPLINTPVTPNQLTTVRLILGLGAAGLFGMGNPALYPAGAVAFILSMLFDRADGELARLGGKTSPGGHAYDLFSDGVCNAAIFVGIGVGLRHSDYGNWAILMGLVAAAAVVSVLWLVVRMEQLEGQRAAELHGAAGFDPDDAMLAVPIAMLLGWDQSLLVAACIGAPVFAFLMLWQFRRAVIHGA